MTDVRKAFEAAARKKKASPRAQKSSSKKTSERICKFCGNTDLPKRRRSFCNDECSHKYRLATDMDYVRSLVWARDAGVCASCGVDTKAQEEHLLEKIRSYAHMQYHIPFKKLRFVRFVSLWEADHINPRYKGGTNDLDNMQTLCLNCHVKKTNRDVKW